MPGVMDPNNPFRVAMRGNSGYQPPRPTRPPVVDTKPGGGGVGPTDPPEPGGGPKPAPTPSPAPIPGAWTPEMQARAERLRQWATDPRRLATVGRRADGSISYDPRMYGSGYMGTSLGMRFAGAGEPQWENGGLVPYGQSSTGQWVQPRPNSAVQTPGSGPLTQGGSLNNGPVWIPVPGMPGGGFYQAPGGG